MSHVWSPRPAPGSDLPVLSALRATLLSSPPTSPRLRVAVLSSRKPSGIPGSKTPPALRPGAPRYGKLPQHPAWASRRSWGAVCGGSGARATAAHRRAPVPSLSTARAGAGGAWRAPLPPRTLPGLRGPHRTRPTSPFLQLAKRSLVSMVRAARTQAERPQAAAAAAARPGRM